MEHQCRTLVIVSSVVARDGPRSEFVFLQQWCKQIKQSGRSKKNLHEYVRARQRNEITFRTFLQWVIWKRQLWLFAGRFWHFRKVVLFYEDQYYKMNHSPTFRRRMEASTRYIPRIRSGKFVTAVTLVLFIRRNLTRGILRINLLKYPWKPALHDL